MYRPAFILASVLAAAALLSACETVEGYRQQTALWLGAPFDALMLEWGPPEVRDTLSDGREIWVYEDVQHHHVDGYSRDVPRTRTIRRVDEDGEAFEFTETYYERRYTPPREWWTSCETRFVIGLDGLVQDYRFAGDGCLAPELD